MLQTSPDVLTKRVDEFPALKGYVDPFRHDGVPVTIQVVVKRADTEFMGFRPRAIEGPMHYLSRNGMVGCKKQEVVPVFPDGHSMASPIRSSHREPETIRSLYRGLGPDFFGYFMVITETHWYGLVPETYINRVANPCGALRLVERRIEVRTEPPKARGGFARLLDKVEYDTDLYFCASNMLEFRTLFPSHFQRLTGSIDPLKSILVSFFSTLECEIHAMERNGVKYFCNKRSFVNPFEVALNNDIARVVLRVSQDTVQIWEIRGTIDNAIAMLHQFAGE